jgi:hypothetical protein
MRDHPPLRPASRRLYVAFSFAGALTLAAALLPLHAGQVSATPTAAAARYTVAFSSLAPESPFAPAQAGAAPSRNIAFINGLWFDGAAFERRTMYSVDGRFSSARPPRIDETLDLGGTWIVPPFGEAHNHNIDGVVEDRTRAALTRYLADGVFYVKIQGNYPLSEEMRRRLPMNRPDAPDVLLAQAFLTASGGHPIQLHETVLLRQGYYPGLSGEQLRNRLYFTIDTEADLDAKWADILALRPDFLKLNLWEAGEFVPRRDDPRFTGMRGLDPTLLPTIVARARQHRLGVSVHISSAADFHHAVEAGVDEIVHSASPSPFNTIPSGAQPAVFNDPPALNKLFIATLSGAGATPSSYRPVSAADARLAAERGIVVITTILGVTRAPENMRPLVRPLTAANLKLLHEHGVRLAVGSDNVDDTSALEFEQLATLGVFDNVTLLKMWTETTPRAIFPERQIGLLRDGYEASFLALGGNPLEDLSHVRRIRFRFKQGVFLR